MKGQGDRHGRKRGPADRQAESSNSYTLSVESGMVQEILSMLREEQRRNEELTKAILDMVKNRETKADSTKTVKPRLIKSFKEDKLDKVHKPELGSVYFDVSKDDVECNFEKLSESETISETVISDDKMKKLRNLVKKGV